MSIIIYFTFAFSACYCENVLTNETGSSIGNGYGSAIGNGYGLAIGNGYGLDCVRDCASANEEAWLGCWSSTG